MKIEKINDDQILWTLEKEDLVRNQVSISDFLTGTPRVRELFHKAIQQAERDLSFRADGYMLHCQLTELSEEKITFSITKKEVIPDVPYLICEFESLDEVISVSRFLNNRLELKNSLYKFEGSYLLILNPEKKDEKQLAWCTVDLSEFGDVEAITAPRRAFIEEHGECLIRDRALQKLREFA